MARRWLPILAVALAACGSRAAEVTTAAEDPSTTTSSTTSPTPTSTTTTAPESTTTTAPSSPPASATATESGIEVTLTIEHGAADAGTRLWADLVITNVGDDVVYWQAGGCAIPGSITIAAERGAAEPDRERGWDGDPSTFTAWVAEHNALDETIRFVDEGAVGWIGMACTSDSHMKAFEPSDTLRQRAAADLRMAPGSNGGRYIATAGFGSYASPDDYGSAESPDQPRPPAKVSVPLELASAPDGADDAVAAFVEAEVLRDFVDRSRTTNVENSWRTELSWWRGAWELWVTPYFDEEGMRALRLRFDPERSEIADARVVWNGQAPEDDPDAQRVDGARPDEVLS